MTRPGVSRDEQERGERRRRSVAISNAIAALHGEHDGRGASRVTTTIIRDNVATVTADPYTAVEKTMIENGARPGAGHAQPFQDWLRDGFVHAVEEATSRTVAALLPQVSEATPLTLEFFSSSPREPIPGD